MDREVAVLMKGEFPTIRQAEAAESKSGMVDSITDTRVFNSSKLLRDP